MDPNLLRTIHDAAVVIEALINKVREMEQGAQQQQAAQQQAEMQAQQQAMQQQGGQQAQKTASNDTARFSFCGLNPSHTEKTAAEQYGSEHSSALDNFNSAWDALSTDILGS